MMIEPTADKIPDPADPAFEVLVGPALLLVFVDVALVPPDLRQYFRTHSNVNQKMTQLRTLPSWPSQRNRILCRN